MDFQEDGGGLRRSVGVTTYPFYVPLEWWPHKGTGSTLSSGRGVGLAASRSGGAPRAEERGFPGTTRTVRSQPASSDLEGSRGTELAELPDGFLPRQDELASHGSFSRGLR